ncbi:transcriptional repressor LexA [soil metagenome]|jgi:repressor LexA
MPDTLTKIERRILDYIVDSLKRNTYQPSIREIGKRFGIKSTKTVSEHLQSLAEKGHIERDASRSRGVRLIGVDLAPNLLNVPYYGRIAAGEPALLREEIVDTFGIDRKLVSAPDSFLLKAEGDSMKEMGIFDGDMVLVEPTLREELKNGDIIAARLDGEATVKRYFARDEDVVLEPANPNYAPILVHDDADFHILGRVTGLIRRFTRKQTEPIEA